jgi:Zn-dependent protease with chaperone function
MSVNKQEILKEDAATWGFIVIAALTFARISLRLIHWIAFFALRDKIAEEDTRLDPALTEKFQKIVNEPYTIRIAKQTGRGKDLGCWTIGGRVITYTVSMRDMLNDDEMIAICLHEYGHTKEKHIEKDIIAEMSDSIVLGAILLGMGAIVGPAGISIIFGTISNLFLFDIKIIETLYKKLVNHKYEYIADSYAHKFGYGKHLMSAFTKFEEYERKIYCRYTNNSRDCSRIMNKLYKGAEHPSNRKRIERLAGKALRTVADVKSLSLRSIDVADDKVSKAMDKALKDEDNNEEL